MIVFILIKFPIGDYVMKVLLSERVTRLSNTIFQTRFPFFMMVKILDLQEQLVSFNMAAARPLLLIFACLFQISTAFRTRGIVSRNGVQQSLRMVSTDSSTTDSADVDAGDNDISIPTYLPSSMGIDYIPLATMLATGDFLAADQFTRDNLIKIAGAEAKGRNFVYFSEVKHLPKVDLCTMERLWLTFSGGKFGFSIQKRIWDVERGNFDSFIRRIGWTKVENGSERKLKWFGANEFTYTVEKAPQGHLPLTSALRGTQLLKALMTLPLWSEYDWKNYKDLKWGP
jgi:hypothetical protein